MEGATPVVQLSNNAQMKMVKICTKCGAEGHCAQDGCTGAAAAAPAPASSSVVPHEAMTAEPAGSMPPPSVLPPSYTDAQIRYSEENGGGLGSSGTAPRRSYVRYHAGRSAKAKGEEKGKSSLAPVPDVPDVPDVPASAYASGTYDAYHAARAERAEVGAKGKTKKGQSKKGKDTRSNPNRAQGGWWNRDLWEYERS